jgi:4-hydroxybenzoate polyprenyltransferase
VVNQFKKESEACANIGGLYVVVPPPPRGRPGNNFGTVKQYIKLVRVQHWIKNFLVFVPVLVGGKNINLTVLRNTSIGVVVFCLLASIIYIVNDIRDIETDRLSERKKNSPLVSGKISVKAAFVVATGIFIVFLAGVLFWLVFTNNGMNKTNKTIAALILLFYMALNICYSFGLKNIPILDVTVIATGFILRFLLGVAIIGVVASAWFYLIILSAAYYMGFGKRRNEAANAENIPRKVLRLYSVNFLDKNMYVCQTLCIVFYSFWTIDSVTIERLGTHSLVWTVPLMLLIFFKYSFNVEKQSGGDPTMILLKDKVLILLCLLYVAVVFFIIYAGNT